MKKTIVTITVLCALLGTTVYASSRVSFSSEKITVFSPGKKVQMTSPQYSGACMNYGHQETQAGDLAANGTVSTDLAYLKASGVSMIRVVMPCYDDPGGITRARGIATSSVSKGFATTTYGICAGDVTPARWAAYKAAVPTEAAWAAANGINHFIIGNEALNSKPGWQLFLDLLNDFNYD